MGRFIMIHEAIGALVQYGLNTGLITEADRIYATNQVLDVLRMDEYEESQVTDGEADLEFALKTSVDYAHETDVLLEDDVIYQDLFNTRLMNYLMPRPNEVIDKSWKHYDNSAEEATDYFYKLSQDSDYICRYRICRGVKWTTDTKYGPLDITVNLSKPEKDPKAIATAKPAKQSGYPKYLLCMGNVGYAGRTDYPARNNHQIIPITANDSQWGFQYSPYVYYNEHCVVFNRQRMPMEIEKQTFIKLFDFVKLFLHYFLGSNADLSIVGGSILTHDYSQGEHYTFAMARAPIEKYYWVDGFDGVEVGIVYWPMSALRLRAKDTRVLIELGSRVLNTWRGHTDEEAFVFAETNNGPHNTITPVARKVGNTYKLDLVLRNNITIGESPLGVYHPHQNLHHIEKGNIDLIEVMGLTVLPSKLEEKLAVLDEYLVEGKDVGSNELIAKRADQVQEFLPKYNEIDRDNVDEILQEEVGLVSEKVLEDVGVFEHAPEGWESFDKFLTRMGFQE